jgi:hypothetical protein
MNFPLLQRIGIAVLAVGFACALLMWIIRQLLGA